MKTLEVGQKVKTLDGREATVVAFFPNQQKCYVLTAKARHSGNYYCYMVDKEGKTGHGGFFPYPSGGRYHEDLLILPEDEDVL